MILSTVLEHVLSQLCQCDLLNAMLVCKEWYNTVWQLPVYLLRPKFRHCVEKPMMEQYLDLYTRAGFSDKHRRLQLLGCHNDNALSFLIEAGFLTDELHLEVSRDFDRPINSRFCFRLKQLRIHFANNLYMYNMTCFLTLISTTLESLGVCFGEIGVFGRQQFCFPNVKDLELRFQSDWSCDEKRMLTDHGEFANFLSTNTFPALTSLAVYKLPLAVVRLEKLIPSTLKHLSVTVSGLFPRKGVFGILNKLDVQLESLEVEEPRYDFNRYRNPHFENSPRYTSLKSLKLTNAYDWSYEELVDLLQGTSPQLEVLYLHDVAFYRWRYEHMVVFLGCCRNVKELTLTQFEDLFDLETCHVLGKALKTVRLPLRKLDLTGSLESLKELRIILRECPSLDLGIVVSDLEIPSDFADQVDKEADSEELYDSDEPIMWETSLGVTSPDF